jgi:hypothetical protein
MLFPSDKNYELNIGYRKALKIARLKTFSIFRKNNIVELVYSSENDKFNYKWTGQSMFLRKKFKFALIDASNGSLLDKGKYEKRVYINNSTLRR